MPYRTNNDGGYTYTSSVAYSYCAFLVSAGTFPASASHLPFFHFLAAAQIMTVVHSASLLARTEVKGIGLKDIDTDRDAGFTIPTR